MTDEAAEAPEVEQNGDRDERGRFAPGNRASPGRPKGARSRLSESFLTDLEKIWAERGPEVLQKLVTEKPAILARIVAGLQPKQVEVKEGAFDQFDDDSLADLAAQLRGAASAPSSDREGTED